MLFINAMARNQQIIPAAGLLIIGAVFGGIGVSEMGNSAGAGLTKTALKITGKAMTIIGSMAGLAATFALTFSFATHVSVAFSPLGPVASLVAFGAGVALFSSSFEKVNLFLCSELRGAIPYLEPISIIH